MNSADFPILEFDPTREAVIEPSRIHANIDAPELCVICFFREVITRMDMEGRLKGIYNLNSEMGIQPLYELEQGGHRIALFHPGVGAPLCGAFLDEVIALGCRKFVAIGSSGVLDGKILVGHLIVPIAAVRDEGTSYHYLPPSREVEPSPEAVGAIVSVLARNGMQFTAGKTWTTDGVFRETPAKVKKRREKGCLTVEMEAAAFFAIAKFRDVKFGQILYGGDDVSGDEWNTRGWTKHAIREKMFDLAVEALVEMK